MKLDPETAEKAWLATTVTALAFGFLGSLVFLTWHYPKFVAQAVGFTVALVLLWGTWYWLFKWLNK